MHRQRDRAQQVMREMKIILKNIKCARIPPFEIG